MTVDQLIIGFLAVAVILAVVLVAVYFLACWAVAVWEDDCGACRERPAVHAWPDGGPGGLCDHCHEEVQA